MHPLSRDEILDFRLIDTLGESAYPAHLEILCTLSKEESYPEYVQPLEDHLHLH